MMYICISCRRGGYGRHIFFGSEAFHEKWYQRGLPGTFDWRVFRNLRFCHIRLEWLRRYLLFIRPRMIVSSTFHSTKSNCIVISFSFLQELMKTVPKDHQELGRDQLLTEPAPYVPLSQVLSSTSLRTTASNGRTKRLVNTNLRKNVKPPWEQQGRVEEWIKTAAPSAVGYCPFVCVMI